MSGIDRSEGIIVAIDGPAGCGKSSTARAVAASLGYRHLDSGAFYRALTLAAIEQGLDPEHWPELTYAQLDAMNVEGVPAARGFEMVMDGHPLGNRIRSPEVNAQVSRMAAVPAVREWLLSRLRESGRSGALVADGRDIGTVVFPDAELKVYLEANPEVRARRRLRQDGNPSPSREQILAETARLQERDRKDSERAVAPLSRAADAVLLDTSHLTFEQQVTEIVRLAKQRTSGPRSA